MIFPSNVKETKNAKIAKKFYTLSYIKGEVRPRFNLRQ